MKDYKTVADVGDDLLSHVKWDKNLVKDLVLLDSGFVNKNEQHTLFFGGTLTGVYRVSFIDQDRDKLFTDILNAVDQELEQAYHRLPYIQAEYMIEGSDSFNLTCIYVAHKLQQSKILNKEQKELGITSILNYMQYSFLTGRLRAHFKYPADPEIAQATYNAMSYKFLLRQIGSWKGVIEYRSKELMKRMFKEYNDNTSTSENLKWKNCGDKLDNNEHVVILINSIRGHIAEMIKGIFDLFLRTHASGNKIHSSSATFEYDGEVILKDKTKGLENYTNYILSVINDKNSFIKHELLAAMEGVMPTTPPAMLENCLVWMSANYQYTKPTDKYKGFVELVMEHAFDQIHKDRSIIKNHGDLTSLMEKFKGLYTSSKSKDEKLLVLRDMGNIIVKLVTNNRDESRIASVRTSIMLYIILRCFTQKHYQ